MQEQTNDNHTGAETRPRPGARSLAVLRIVLGAVFLWPALDKTLGLGYGTPAGQAWFDGVSPTAGYLASRDGTFSELFQSMGGQAWVDALFIGGMAAVGTALILGVGMRLAAVGSVCLMGMLYLSAWPLQNNPVVDEHLVYVVLAVALAATNAGDSWGLGQRWARLSPIRSQAWLR
ncbi:membrane protein [Haloglycomyces albus]|uniref:membrane protein n=1 Tax=Haloglycomyces albus TaxID=526067 RepID=UPI00046D31CF